MERPDCSKCKNRYTWKCDDCMWKDDSLIDNFEFEGDDLDE